MDRSSDITASIARKSSLMTTLRFLATCTALACCLGSLIPGIGEARVGEPFTISNVRCRAISCRVGEGMQPGLSTLEISGTFRDYAGTSVRLAVAKKVGEELRLIADRKVGVMSDGALSTSIPVHLYDDGTYVMALSQLDTPEKPFAAGVFVKSEAHACEQTSTPASTGATLSGDWRGINGTAGLIHFETNGVYTFNGVPGRYTYSGRNLVFSGPLAAWNDGHATLNDGVIEFDWTNSQGWKQYFVFSKT